MSNSTRNKTLQLTRNEEKRYSRNLLKLSTPTRPENLLNKTVCQNLLDAVQYLPEKFVDLMIIDPPYNLSKQFNSINFQKKSIQGYAEWFEEIIIQLKKVLKPTASVYICGNWYSSISLPLVLEKHFIIRNRITWEREKGRGSKKNWKNNSEDIWFCTVSGKYTFNTEKVKLLRKVMAPYKQNNGDPKDWQRIGENGYRLTYPSNLWNDISVPFWSMPENTEHPTQKPEKLIAKLILASSKENDVVFDPFLGSGTTSVTARKLKRKYLGIELDKFYACLSEKRLDLAGTNNSIQGYEYKTFWERNTIPFNINKNPK